MCKSCKKIQKDFEKKIQKFSYELSKIFRNLKKKFQTFHSEIFKQ